MKKSILLLVFIAFSTCAVAQKKDTSAVGTVVGLVRDSLHNYNLASATISIYKTGEELVKYQLSNNYGRFEFKEIPVGIRLEIVVSKLGYGPLKKNIFIPRTSNSINLDTLNLTKLNILLNEVKISAPPPPIQMHGDTLEFNAAAFKLDTNAVAGDFLRKLPGVTVWTDGLITVNGKKINKLLVEGKEFFSTDSKIALQNIAKNAIQKVQVYQNKSDSDPINPVTEMNIVLKKDKKDGYFGKIGGGYGSDKHFAADGMISYFSPRTQLSVVGASNDVNKTANDVATLISYNSFKGEGILNDYHSDFTRQGLNIFKAFGLNLQHDFNKDLATRPEDKRGNLLKADYFLSDLSNQILEKSQSIITLGQEKISRNNSIDQTSSSLGSHSSGKYLKEFEHSAFTAEFLIDHHSNNNQSVQQMNSVTNESDESSSNSKKNVSYTADDFHGDLKFSTSRYYDIIKKDFRSVNLIIHYQFDLFKSNQNQSNLESFNASDTSLNKYINRKYLNNINASTHVLETDIFSLTSLLRKPLALFSIDFKNTFTYSNRREIADVADQALLSTYYVPNNYLTNNSKYQVKNEITGLNFSKTGRNFLDSRYDKNWAFNFFAGNQFYSQNNVSQKSFQYIDRHYYYFVPSISFRYNDNEYGDFTKNYTVVYNTNVVYPNMVQIAPLVDDANFYFIDAGNINLKPSYTHELSFLYNYDNSKAKNPVLNNLKATISFVERNITDSTFYDNLGRSVHYFINGAPLKAATFYDYFSKAIKLDQNQFQTSVSLSTRYAQYNSNINQVNYSTFNSSLSTTLQVSYSYKSLLTTSIAESYYGNRSIQKGISDYTYYNWRTTGGVAFALPKGLFFNSRVDFNNSRSAQLSNIYYTIWNADIGWRFLKGANGEIKFSALDLLHQNKNIFYTINGNIITNGSTNVLQQYFLLTLAYYPRKFGLSKSNSKKL